MSVTRYFVFPRTMEAFGGSLGSLWKSQSTNTNSLGLGSSEEKQPLVGLGLALTPLFLTEASQTSQAPPNTNACSSNTRRHPLFYIRPKYSVSWSSGSNGYPRLKPCQTWTPSTTHCPTRHQTDSHMSLEPFLPKSSHVSRMPVSFVLSNTSHTTHPQLTIHSSTSQPATTTCPTSPS